ncbi:hypothetical protein D3C72_1761510 [compost metagenome]
MPSLERVDAARIDIETDDRTLLAELHRKGQTDVAEAHDSEFHILNSQHNTPFTVEHLRHLKIWSGDG